MPSEYKISNSRIMYVEDKSEGLEGPARIGRVFFSKSGKTLYYRGKKFRSLKGGYKANYFDVETGDEYWIQDQGKTRTIGFMEVTVASRSTTMLRTNTGALLKTPNVPLNRTAYSSLRLHSAPFGHPKLRAELDGGRLTQC